MVVVVKPRYKSIDRIVPLTKNEKRIRLGFEDEIENDETRQLRNQLPLVSMHHCGFTCDLPDSLTLEMAAH